MLDSLEEWILPALHLSIVGLHFTEIMHASVLTIGVLIALTYMILSAIDLEKSCRRKVGQNGCSEAPKNHE